MAINFRYKIEVEGQEPYWMWCKAAAVTSADTESYNHEEMGVLNVKRVRTARVVDETSGQIVAQFGPAPALKSKVPYSFE